MIMFTLYPATWKLKRNYKFKRYCTHSGYRILPFQMMYEGTSTVMLNAKLYRLSVPTYIFLKIKGEV